jgi:hypothetical protein
MVAAKTPSLDLIQIASPCTANWDEMKGDERMRHCGQCKLDVFNLSDMTRDEATAFLAERTGRTCVRMFKRADGTVITRDCPVGLAALRARLVRLSLATLALVLTLTATALTAFAKVPYLSNYLSQGKFSRFAPLNRSTMVMGDICPAPPIMPTPVPQVPVNVNNAQPTVGRLGPQK